MLHWSAYERWAAIKEFWHVDRGPHCLSEPAFYHPQHHLHKSCTALRICWEHLPKDKSAGRTCSTCLDSRHLSHCSSSRRIFIARHQLYGVSEIAHAIGTCRKPGSKERKLEMAPAPAAQWTPVHCYPPPAPSRSVWLRCCSPPLCTWSCWLPLCWEAGIPPACPSATFQVSNIVGVSFE